MEIYHSNILNRCPWLYLIRKKNIIWERDKLIKKKDFEVEFRANQILKDKLESTYKIHYQKMKFLINKILKDEIEKKKK